MHGFCENCKHALSDQLHSSWFDSVCATWLLKIIDNKDTTKLRSNRACFRGASVIQC